MFVYFSWQISRMACVRAISSSQRLLLSGSGCAICFSRKGYVRVSTRQRRRYKSTQKVALSVDKLRMVLSIMGTLSWQKNRELNSVIDTKCHCYAP